MASRCRSTLYPPHCTRLAAQCLIPALSFCVLHTILFHLFHHPLFTGDVWIIGDSIVRRAATMLGSGPPVHWNGRGEARYRDINQLLAELEAQCPRPAMLIVNVGTNDLGDTDFFCMRQRIALFMKERCDKYPWTKLVWSDILPCACYFGTINPSKLEMKRRAVNRWARSLSRRMGVSVLHHPQFRWSEFSLYRYDGVLLSNTGNMHFQLNLRDSICAPP